MRHFPPVLPNHPPSFGGPLNLILLNGPSLIQAIPCYKSHWRGSWQNPVGAGQTMVGTGPRSQSSGASLALTSVARRDGYKGLRTRLAQFCVKSTWKMSASVVVPWCVHSHITLPGLQAHFFDAESHRLRLIVCLLVVKIRQSSQNFILAPAGPPKTR